MVKNLCESCTHSSRSELTENAAGEEIFWYLCDKKYTYGSVKVSVPPHSKCSKYKPANKPEEKNGKNTVAKDKEIKNDRT